MSNTKAKTIAVDTDQQWIDQVRSNNTNSSKLKAYFVDLGEVSTWGRPISYSKRDNFIIYISKIWKGKEKPELILIDGRFRVSCFLYSLLNALPNSFILFDDYINRPWYHIVEEILCLHNTCGRQGVFKVPKSFDRKYANRLCKQFLYVMD